MRVLSASEILGVWERGLRQHPVDRALTLLTTAYPDSQADWLAELGIGRRDACLLNLRERIFGATLHASARCPRCAQPLEFTLLTTELDGGDSAGRQMPHELAEDGVVVRYRLPNTVDLRAVAGCADMTSARRLLVDRCVLSPGVDVLTEQVISKLAARLSESDPLADVTLALQCAECSHSWRVIFDIATFLWNEIDALAKRLMVEVHTLARAYGWREDDILAMSAGRRQYYLEMAG
jgi:hypothetical protein